MANNKVLPNIYGLPQKVIEKILAGKVRKLPYTMVFSINLADGEQNTFDQRTNSAGVFQIEFVNVGANDIFKYNIKDTYTNQNWFTDYVYSFLFGGDGRSMGLLPCPILLPPSTNIIISAIYNSADPNAGGSDSVTGQIILGGYVLEGLTAEDLRLT